VIGFGKGWSGLDGLKEDLPTWHSDVFLAFPTVYVNGKKIVDLGHLMLLDDPEIRNSAGSGSDPGGLLGYNQEGWPQLRRLLVSMRVTP